MQSQPLLVAANTHCQALVAPLLEDLRSAPLVAATPGGNHAHWIAGHLLCSEGMFRAMMEGGTSSQAHLEPLFGGGTTPAVDGAGYPSYGEIVTELGRRHQETLAWLGTMGEEELDRASLAVPPGFEPFFGTWRQCLLMRALHWMNHRGQLADCRRAAGRPPLMA